MESGVLREQLRQLVRHLGILDKNDAGGSELSLAQCHALVEIGRRGKMNLNELADTLNVDKSTVSRTLNHLVKAHLAVRLPDDADRRYVVIRLTERGERLFETTETAMDAYYRAVFERIPQAKRAQVVDSLLVLNEAIGSDPCC